jgi:hypothetical protein
MYNESEYRQWLVESEGKAGRSISDLCSRVRRVSKLLGKTEHSLVSKDLLRLEQVDLFIKCSTSVKSQLRQSVRLYLKFLAR